MRVLVLGGSGLVGTRFRELNAEVFELDAPGHAELDVLDFGALERYVRASPADVVLNLVACTNLDSAELERDDREGVVFRTNATLAGRLASLCAALDRRLVHVSTDYVFDGEQAERPYREGDPVRPLCWYAQTKQQGEELALASGQEVCIARIEMPFTGRPHRKSDFARFVVGRLRAGQEVVAVDDQKITPIFLDDAALALRMLVAQHQPGVIHLASTDWTTPLEFASAIADGLGLDRQLIRGERFDRFAPTRRARRPRHSWLDVSAFSKLVDPAPLHSLAAEVDALTRQLRAA
ncbi:MAG: NAD(P)-dependent oxidoreductase [Chloroflexi bacterium]|nr:NAD(P)-dependent oxidoreductase [Chloroflexota bacterium]